VHAHRLCGEERQEKGYCSPGAGAEVSGSRARLSEEQNALGHLFFFWARYWCFQNWPSSGISRFRCRSKREALLHTRGSALLQITELDAKRGMSEEEMEANAQRLRIPNNWTTTGWCTLCLDRSRRSPAQSTRSLCAKPARGLRRKDYQPTQWFDEKYQRYWSLEL